MGNVKNKIEDLFNQRAVIDTKINELVIQEVKKAGKEGLEVINDSDTFEECTVTIVGRHDENINIVIDRVRYGVDKKGLEFHVCQWDDCDEDEWVHSSNLSQEAIYYVYQCIVF